MHEAKNRIKQLEVEVAEAHRQKQAIIEANKKLEVDVKEFKIAMCLNTNMLDDFKAQSIKIEQVKSDRSYMADIKNLEQEFNMTNKKKQAIINMEMLMHEISKEREVSDQYIKQSTNSCKTEILLIQDTKKNSDNLNNRKQEIINDVEPWRRKRPGSEDFAKPLSIKEAKVKSFIPRPAKSSFENISTKNSRMENYSPETFCKEVPALNTDTPVIPSRSIKKEVLHRKEKLSNIFPNNQDSFNCIRTSVNMQPTSTRRNKRFSLITQQVIDPG